MIAADRRRGTPITQFDEVGDRPGERQKRAALGSIPGPRIVNSWYVAGAQDAYGAFHKHDAHSVCHGGVRRVMVATVVDGHETLSSEAVMDRALRGVNGLRQLGVKPGDVVALLLRNEARLLEAMLAVRLAGARSCAINWHFNAEEAGYILRDSGAAALIAHTDLLGQVASGIPKNIRVVAVETPPSLRGAFGMGDGASPPSGAIPWEHLRARASPYEGPPLPPLAPMPYSSGTTGKPKGIRRKPPTAEHQARAADVNRIAFGIGPGLRTALVVPLYHSAPSAHGLQALLNGELVLIHPRFDAERLLADIERYRLNNLYLVPTLFVRLLRLSEAAKRRHDLSSLRFVLTTGSACPIEVKKAMIEWWGPVVAETYGSSEVGPVTYCSAEESLARPGSVGRALPGAQVRIYDDAGTPLAARKRGAIYCRQSALPDFTYNNNAAARRTIERDGLFGLGDIGYLDEAGYLYVCERTLDVVISGGVNIYPAEIEQVLMAMPGVADCAVFGIPDQEYGESLAAYVQGQPGMRLDGEATRAFVRNRLAGYKVPRLIKFVDALPREDTGKILKRKLRAPYWPCAS